MDNKETEALAACFQSVAQDLKTLGSLDQVCSRAVKLAQQLNSTASCLVSFSDSIQLISDSANNHRGASRDIGAVLTRFCLRQRALEKDLKNLSSALLDNFASPLEKRGPEWKRKLNEIERTHQRNSKKTRSKKQQQVLKHSLAGEYRSDCIALLGEQRSQFSEFACILLPVIKAQVSLYDEGLHVKSVGEAIEQCVTSGDPKAAINTVLEDVCHNDDSSWRKRLSSPTRNAYYGNGNDSCSSPSTSSISYYGTVSSAASSRPQTLSSSTGFGQRAPLSAQTFVPPSTPFVDFAKPPLPRKYNEGNVCANGNQVPSMSNAFSVSANDLSRQFNQRPLSFSGDSDAPLEGMNKDTGSLSETISQLVDQLNDEIHSMCDEPSTLRQMNNEPSQRLSMDIIPRPDTIRPPPPPPERRNSTITAATPTAPSIVDLRNAGVFSNNPNIRTRSIHDLNQPAYYNNENGVVYRAPFVPTYANGQQFDQLPEPPNNAMRANSYQPQQTPSTYRPPPPYSNNSHF